jgi:signal peptide peptidase SppA
MSHELAVQKFAAQLVGRPLAMSQDAARNTLDLMPSLGVEARAPLASAGESPPYSREGGVAVIPICGPILNRPTWITEILGYPSYHGLSAALRAAIADPAVRGVVLDIDSGGGEFAGAIELAAEVRRLSATKPIVALADNVAASAAYIIAAAATRVIVAPSATVGSIGVVWVHMDRSAALAKGGLKPTFIHAGARKVDGNSMQPLAPDAEKAIRAQLGEAHELMLQSIGAHRPALGASGARATEAGLYMGQKAVDARLADAVGTRETAINYASTGPRPGASAAASPARAASPAPSASAPLSPLSPASGATHMPSPATTTQVSPTLAALLAPLPSGALRSQEAVRRIVDKAQRVDAANALVACQLKGQTAEDSWADALMKSGAASRSAEATTAAAKSATAADPWADVMAKVNGGAAIPERRR